MSCAAERTCRHLIKTETLVTWQGCWAQGIVGSMPWIAFGWLTLYMQLLVRCPFYGLNSMLCLVTLLYSLSTCVNSHPKAFVNMYMQCF